MYIYIYMWWVSQVAGQAARQQVRPSGGQARPVSILRVSKLRFVDSNSPGSPPWAWEFHPSNFKIIPGSNPLKSRISVRRLAVPERESRGAA